MSDPTWDFEGFGAIRVQVHFTAHTPESLRAVLDRQTAAFTSDDFDPRQRYFLVIDARSLERASADVRRMQAEWLNEHREFFQKTCLGMAFVMRSRLARGALTAIFWMTDNPVPYTVHATLQDALDEAARACRSARVDFPAEVETRGAEIVEAAIVEYQRGRSSA